MSDIDLSYAHAVMHLSDQIIRAGCCELYVPDTRRVVNYLETDQEETIAIYYFYVVLTSKGTTLQLDVMTTPSGTVTHREWSDPHTLGFSYYGFDGRNKVEYVYPFKPVKKLS
jgi:hypothetical protein